MDKYGYAVIILGVVVIIVLIWVNIFLNIKVDSSVFPTFVNGTTASSSIIIGLSGVIIGIMLRDEQMPRRTKNFYYGAMLLLLFPITMLWTTYASLAGGVLGSWLSYYAVRIALSGLILSLYIFFGIAVYTVKVSIEEQR